MSFLTPILIGGPDARGFLQGQVTCDTNAISRDHAHLAALNSAQGRVQAVLSLREHDAGMVAAVATSMAERTLHRLRKYVLRAKVTIELAPSDMLSTFGALSANASVLEFIRLGIPHVLPETHESFVAQMLNLDLLDAINFNKGCYTGQEIIARTHFRGAIKRRMFRFAANSAPPSPGTRIASGAEHAGDVIYATDAGEGSELLAVISLAQIQSPLEVGDVPLRMLSLPYEVTGVNGE